MRPSFLCAILAAVVLAGCVEAPVESVRPPNERGTRTVPSLPNEPPQAVIIVTNATGATTPIHFVSEPVRFNASSSRDPDGRIERLLWKFWEPDGSPTTSGETGSQHVNYSFATPGTRSVFLYVEDDRGSLGFDSVHVEVHRRILTNGRLLLSPVADRPDDPLAGRIDFSLVDHPVALSVNVTHAAEAGARLAVEVWAPNGTRLERTVATTSPAWVVVPLPPGASGNFTTLLRLESGPTLAYQAELIAWYR